MANVIIKSDERKANTAAVLQAYGRMEMLEKREKSEQPENSEQLCLYQYRKFQVGIRQVE